MENPKFSIFYIIFHRNWLIKIAEKTSEKTNYINFVFQIINERIEELRFIYINVFLKRYNV